MELCYAPYHHLYIHSLQLRYRKQINKVPQLYILLVTQHHVNYKSYQLIIIQHTIGNGLHGNSSSILPIALLIELDYWLSSVLLWRMQRVQAALMSAELLHCPGTKRITGCDQHSETILYQPERDLSQDKEKRVSRENA